MKAKVSRTDSSSSKAAFWIIPGLFGFLPLVFDTDLYQFALLPKLALLQFCVLTLAMFWSRDLSNDIAVWSSPAIFLPATGFFLWSAVATVFTNLNVFAATTFLAHQMSFFLLFIVVSQTTTAEMFDRATRWSCVSGLVFSMLGCLEFWGVDLSAIPSNGRPSSTFAYRNFAASYLIAVLPLAILQMFRSKTYKDLSISSFAAALMGLFLVYSRSRGAWLGTGVAIVFAASLYSIWRYNFIPRQAVIRRKSGLVTAIAAGALLVLLAPWPPEIRAPQSRAIDEGKSKLLDAMSSLSTSGAGRGRLIMWENTARMAQDHLLIGVGPGNWRVAYPAYDRGQMIQVGSAPERPHNDLLWILAETGVPGLAFHLIVVGIALVLVIREVARKGEHSATSVALASGLVAIFVHGLFSFPRERVETSFFFWVSLALIHGLSSRHQTSREKPTLALPYAVPTIAALCLGITILEIRFDRALLQSLQSYKIGDTLWLDRSTREALAAGPFDSRAYLLRNKADQARGNYALAQAACLDGLRYHPNSVELLGDLGMVYALDGQFNKAEAVLIRATELSPNHHQVYNNLGGVYQRLYKLDEAKSAYLKATRLKRDYTDAWSNLGLLQMIQGQYQEAVQSFAQALEHSSNEPALHHNLADALYMRDGDGDRATAAKHYQVFLRLWRGDPAESGIAKQRVAQILE